ncbi:MAG: putative signal transducing protein [Polaromonas sp.]
MLRLARAPNIVIAALWADALQQAGFDASVQRYFLSSIAGELPPDQCLPEVWLTHDEDEPRARALLHALQNMPQRRWLCICGEFVEGGFEQCWHCGVAMPVELR